ncbi:hypothetical protein QUF58_06840 [Anaerolineales bacterium HSG24]|nr:hypothetical protein [Anaerolineales bacterium HSG24]
MFILFTNTVSQTSKVMAILLALALVRGIIYASIVPPWQAPDEPAHFERAKAAFNTIEWVGSTEQPVWYDNIRDSLFTFRFWHYALPHQHPAPDQPLNHYIQLYHEVYGGLYSSRVAYLIIGLPIIMTSNQPIVLQLYAMRLYTVLFGVLMVWLGYLLTKTIFPNDLFLSLGVPILITFTPQHTHLLSTVNNGNLAEVLATVSLLLLVRGVMAGFSWSLGGVIIVVAIFAMWTKATTYFLIFPLIVIGSLYLLRYRRHWHWLLPLGFIIISVVYYFIPTRLLVLIGWGWQHLMKSDLYMEPTYLSHIFRSFWAMPGWLHLRLNPFWYKIVLGFVGVGVGGLLIRLGRLAYQKFRTTSDELPNHFVRRLVLVWQQQCSPQQQRQLLALAILALAILSAVSIQIGWHIITGSMAYHQGRSIYPVIVPLYLFLLLGWQQVIPASKQPLGLITLTTLFILFDGLVLFNYIIPFFHTSY